MKKKKLMGAHNLIIVLVTLNAKFYHMMLILVPMVSHDQKDMLQLTLVVLLTDGMMPLIMSSEAHDVDTSANGVT